MSPGSSDSLGVGNSSSSVDDGSSVSSDGPSSSSDGIKKSSRVSSLVCGMSPKSYSFCFIDFSFAVNASANVYGKKADGQHRCKLHQEWCGSA